MSQSRGHVPGHTASDEVIQTAQSLSSCNSTLFKVLRELSLQLDDEEWDHWEVALLGHGNFKAPHTSSIHMSPSFRSSETSNYEKGQEMESSFMLRRKRKWDLVDMHNLLPQNTCAFLVRIYINTIILKAIFSKNFITHTFISHNSTYINNLGKSYTHVQRITYKEFFFNIPFNNFYNFVK